MELERALEITFQLAVRMESHLILVEYADNPEHPKLLEMIEALNTVEDFLVNQLGDD